MNILSTLGYGGQVMLIGLAVVFFGLILLIACIYIMSWIFGLVKKARAENAEKATLASAPVQAAPVEEAPAVEETVNDAQLIAVIAAAIAAYDHSGKSLVVRKVKRVPGWNGSARQEQIYRF